MKSKSPAALTPPEIKNLLSQLDGWSKQRKEIVKEFDAVAYFENAAEGYWRHGDMVYRDDLGLIIVDVPDTARNRKWMKAYKARWKERLDQLEILRSPLSATPSFSAK